MVTTTITEPADLTPAVDKFLRIPPKPKSDKDIYFMTAKGPSPDGPDPFGLVQEELKPLSDYVKELVLSENPVLTMAASHFFEQVEVFSFIYIILNLLIVILLIN
jgi:hypothetical protein